MKICIILLFGYLTLSNAAISQTRRGNTHPHSAPNSYNFASRTQSKTNYVASSAGKDDKVLRHEMEMKNDGSYHYQYETSNGIAGKEQGIGGLSVQGSSSYISPEGVEIKMTYTADENGYHPVGDHIPKTPDYILRALEYIRTHPHKENEETHKGLSKKIPKLTTYIAPPTHKPAPKKIIQAPKRSSSYTTQKKGKRF